MEIQTESKLIKYLWRATFFCHLVWFIPLVVELSDHQLVTAAHLHIIMFVFAPMGCVLQGALHISERWRRSANMSTDRMWRLLEISTTELNELKAQLAEAEGENTRTLLEQAHERESKLRIAHADAMLDLVRRAIRGRSPNKLPQADREH